MSSRAGSPKYPAPLKAWAVSLAADQGIAEASRATKVPKATISDWSKKAGVQPFVEHAARERTRHARVELERKRAEGQVRRQEQLEQVSDLGLAATLRELASPSPATRLSEIVGAWTRAHHDLALIRGEATETVDVTALLEKISKISGASGALDATAKDGQACS